MKTLSKKNVKSENCSFFAAQNLAVSRVSGFDSALRGVKETKTTIAIPTTKRGTILWSKRNGKARTFPTGPVRGPRWQRDTFE